MTLNAVFMILLATFCLTLVSCQSGAPSKNQSLRVTNAPTDAIVHIAKVAQQCWFKSGDAAFRTFKLANETNSYAGRPRFLLVKKKDPGGLPSLVVQAEQKGTTASGTFTSIQTFGPLLATSSGKRINDDVKRWSNGESDC